MATAVAMLLVVGCQREEITDSDEPGTGKLQFSPSLGEAQTATRAGESDNDVLKAASPAGENPFHIVIETYTGTPGSSLKPYFSDELGYFETGWDVNSGNPRFLPSGGMNLYAYFATNVAHKGDLSRVGYTPAEASDHPKLTFVVEDDAPNQVDLIAAKVENITQSNVMIPFRHILSQINFGVKGIDQHQITVTNIRINKVRGAGLFDYESWKWTPDTKSDIHTYPYYFPDYKKGDASSGLGDKYSTQGTVDDSQNSYFFGDGGKFGPGKDSTFLYAQPAPTTSSYATKEKTTTPLCNSLMLLPQEITKNDVATVTFDYEIKLNGKTVRSDKDNTVRLDAYYDWDPNFRYVYLFKFDDPKKVTFDVLIEQWQYFDNDDGIVGTDELTPKNLFDKYVRPLKPSEEYSVLIGPLSSDYLCDWSLYAVDNSFIAGESFTLSFDSDLPFQYGKSVIIHPPFGFTASTSELSAKGTVTFTPIKSYYSSAAAINLAVGSGIGNYEFYVNDAVKLEEITFTGSATAESALALHFLSPYTAPPPSRWSMYDGKTAVCFPNDYAMTNGSVPYSYTIYTVQGLRKVFDWMNTDGIANPGDGNKLVALADRMRTNINLAAIGKYDLAEVYKSDDTDTKTAYVPIGTDGTPYTGIFDGRGATVENLYIGYGSGRDWEGLFGYIGSTGQAKFINLKDVSIYSGAATFVGGVVGMSMSGSIVTGCSVSGTIHGGYTGGIAGQNSGIIYSCGSTAQLTTFSSGNVGGIAGVNWNLVQGCYSTSSNVNITGGNIQGNNSKNVYVAGSDVGTNHASVTRVPSIAALNGKIPHLNAVEAAQYTGAHFLSGNLNATPPSIAVGNPAGGAGGGVLKGTFIQNWFALYWSEDKWDEEMALLATVGMEYLVIDQVMEFSDYLGNNQYMSWYPASQSVLTNNTDYYINGDAALKRCMDACRKHGIKLFIGTFFDKRYWNDGAAVTNQVLWNNCITTSNNIMKELTGFYFNGAGSTKGDYTDVLAGWYFPYEVDDLNFQTPDAQTLLENGIRSAITCRNGLAATAKKPYLFSPFMNGNGPHAYKDEDKKTMDATEYAALWEDIIKNTGFQKGDILSPQDCIGTGKFLISDIHVWMPKLRDVAKTKEVEFWINVELFTPDGNASNVSDLTGQQIPASNSYAAKLISFSYPIHYSPKSDRKGAYKVYYDAQ